MEVPHDRAASPQLPVFSIDLPVPRVQAMAPRAGGQAIADRTS